MFWFYSLQDMKKIIMLIVMFTLQLFSKTLYVSDQVSFDIRNVSEGDSVLFKRGERYYTHLNLFKDSPDSLYFGSYGDTSLVKPVLDGSIYHFDFDAQSWSDFEDINGIRFYKKHIKDLELVENVYCDGENMTMAREPDLDETVVIGEDNSFGGFFKIDSVDVKEPRRIFYDPANKADWSGADLVAKTQQWSYEIRKIRSSVGGKFELEENMHEFFRKNWGYFIQRHFSALDSEGEWYYDEVKGVLYFSPLKDKGTIFISSNREEDNAGFDIRRASGIKIEDLHFENGKFGVRLEKASDIKVDNCSFKNNVYGVANKTTTLDKISVSCNTFKNMRSYAVRLISNDSYIGSNEIDSVGLSLSCESLTFNNLNGIELYGKNNVIEGNSVKNIGYCGIRIYDCPGAKVLNNRIENTGLTLADCGAIYTWHAFEGNKLIKGNYIKNSVGNVDGTTGKPDHSRGIYLDEMSLHFRVDSNYVSDTGEAIYIQNSRSDTIVNNFTENNRRMEFHLNHAGRILNGGVMNPNNDPDFKYDGKSPLPEDYHWDDFNKLLYYKEKRHGTVYVEPGNNYVADNVFMTDTRKNKYSIQFKTWRHLTDSIVEDLAGNDNFFYNNIPDSLVPKTGLLIQGSNLWDDYFEGKEFDVVENRIDIKTFNFLRKVKVWIGRGKKPCVEKLNNKNN